MVYALDAFGYLRRILNIDFQLSFLHFIVRGFDLIHFVLGYLVLELRAVGLVGVDVGGLGV